MLCLYITDILNSVIRAFAISYLLKKMFAHFKQIAAPMSHFPRNYKKAKGSSKLSDDTGHCDCNSGSKLPQFSVFLQVQ